MSMLRRPSTARFPVTAMLRGQPISTTVDSELAKYYLEHYLTGTRTNPEWNAALDSIHGTSHGRIPTRDELKVISQNWSVDLATLFLVHRILDDPGNRSVKKRFDDAFQQIKLKRISQRPSPRGKYVFVFVPGWLYASNPANGGDFAMPRQALEQAGVETRLIAVRDNGTVEQNSEIIMERLKEWSTERIQIIMISVSKGGAEVVLALNRPSSLAQISHVAAWVNIGGAVGGSRLADYISGPRRWYTWLFVTHCRSLSGLDSLLTERSRMRTEKLALPADLLVLNYVGIPLSGQITEPTEYGYSLLKDDGPNDGLHLISDEIVPQGDTIIELGLDHYYRHPEIDLKTIALATTVIDLLEESPRRQRVTITG
jgi:hypothetical protein